MVRESELDGSWCPIWAGYSWQFDVFCRSCGIWSKGVPIYLKLVDAEYTIYARFCSDCALKDKDHFIELSAEDFEFCDVCFVMFKSGDWIIRYSEQFRPTERMHGRCCIDRYGRVNL